MKDILSMQSMFSFIVIGVLFYSGYITIKQEAMNKIENLFRICQANLYSCVTNWAGNVPVHQSDYEKLKEKIFNSMKKEDVVRKWFKDDELKKFIIEKFEEIFKISGNRPV